MTNIIYIPIFLFLLILAFSEGLIAGLIFRFKTNWRAHSIIIVTYGVIIWIISNVIPMEVIGGSSSQSILDDSINQIWGLIILGFILLKIYLFRRFTQEFSVKVNLFLLFTSLSLVIVSTIIFVFFLESLGCVTCNN